MNAWYWAALFLMVGGLGPALLLGARQGAVDRLVGLEMTGAVTVLVMLVLAQVFGSTMLVVPFALVVLSFTGVMVFTRLLGPR